MLLWQKVLIVRLIKTGDMIDLLLKNNEIRSFQSIDEMICKDLDFLIMQFQNYTQSDINWVKENFGIDFSIMSHYEDIEISSHFLETKEQVSFHFSIPYYNKEKQLVEEPVFIIISGGRLFSFESADFDNFINEIYPYRLSVVQQQANDIYNVLKLYS